jgi:hypothetical protein
VTAASTISADGSTAAGIIAQHGGRVCLAAGGTCKNSGGSGDLVALSGGTIVAGTVETTNGTGAPALADTNVGAFNQIDPEQRGLIFGPATTNAVYTPTNVTPDRAFDADSVVVAELADIVGTLIADLQAKKILD